MPSTGWQGAKWVHTVNNWLQYYADLRVDGMDHQGDRLHIWGALALNCNPGSSGGGGQQNVVNGIHGTVNGSGGSFGTNFRQGTNYYANYDTWIDNVPSASTSATITAHYASYNNASGSSTFWTADPSWTVYFGSSGVEPSMPTVSIVSIGSEGAVFHVKTTSYGEPVLPDRYIEAKICAIDKPEYFGQPNKWAKAVAQLEADIAVNNSSDGEMTIIANNEYRYGANTRQQSGHDSPNYPAGTFFTKPFPASGMHVVSNNEDGNVTLSYELMTSDMENAQRDIVTKYSVNNDDWQIANTDIIGRQCSFTLHFDHHNQVFLRVIRSGMSDSDVVSINFVPSVNENKIYGSVGNVTKKINTLYGPVNGQSKKITKLYASVDGRATLIYKD